MADLASDVRRAVIKLSLQDQPAADTSPKRNADDVRSADSGATPELAERRAIRVVIEGCIELHSAGDLVSQRKILPPQIWRDDDDSLGPIERARCADADADEIGPLGPGLCHCLRDHLFDHAGDSRTSEAAQRGINRKSARAPRSLGNPVMVVAGDVRHGTVISRA